MCHNTSAGTVEKAIASRKATNLVAVPRGKLCVRGLLCLWGPEYRTCMSAPRCRHQLGGRGPSTLPSSPVGEQPSHQRGAQMHDTDH